MAAGDPAPDDDEGPPRRAFIVAAIVVIVLILGGLALTQGLLNMSKLQDCAATGRRDC